MELDSSVNLSLDREVKAVSPLAPEKFAVQVLSLMPENVKTGDLGCGRILADYSIMMQTRYVLCDIYEDGKETSAEGETSYRYRIEIKSGKKTSRIGDAVYCVLFLILFWFLGKWFTVGFNPLFVAIAALAAISAAYLLWSGARSKFGPEQSSIIAERLAGNLR